MTEIQKRRPIFKHKTLKFEADRFCEQGFTSSVARCCAEFERVKRVTKIAISNNVIVDWESF